MNETENGIEMTPEYADAIVLSLRLCARAEGSPPRCQRKRCRSTGDCHFSITDKGPGCINSRMLKYSALMILFTNDYVKVLQQRYAKAAKSRAEGDVGVKGAPRPCPHPTIRPARRMEDG